LLKLQHNGLWTWLLCYAYRAPRYGHPQPYIYVYICSQLYECGDNYCHTEPYIYTFSRYGNADFVLWKYDRRNAG